MACHPREREQLAEMDNITHNEPRNVNQAGGQQAKEGSNMNENADAEANGLENQLTVDVREIDVLGIP